jgi:hypothetical protein
MDGVLQVPGNASPWGMLRHTLMLAVIVEKYV